ncbi:hypothetical protein ACFYYN_28095, partial [Streptomyces sp. NPDC001902]
ALTFGTLLSSQGTEASFETVSPAPPGFPFVVTSLSDSFGPDSRRRGFPAFAFLPFGFRAPRLYQMLSVGFTAPL